MMGLSGNDGSVTTKFCWACGAVGRVDKKKKNGNVAKKQRRWYLLFAAGTVVEPPHQSAVSRPTITSSGAALCFEFCVFFFLSLQWMGVINSAFCATQAEGEWDLIIPSLPLGSYCCAIMHIHLTIGRASLAVYAKSCNEESFILIHTLFLTLGKK